MNRYEGIVKSYRRNRVIETTGWIAFAIGTLVGAGAFTVLCRIGH
jgi:hypothetical protein